MSSASIKAIEPFNKECSDLIVSFEISISNSGMPTQSKTVDVRFKDLANASKEKIDETIISRIYSILENIPSDI